MKIPENHVNGLAGNGTGAAERARQTDPLSRPQPVPRDGVGRSEDGDSVQLSHLSTHLRLSAEDSPERLERVEQLRTLVQTGRYNPDPQELSRKIIEDAVGYSGLGPEKG
jgi:anti-sigma28 factor (negative regulator of flagellin synthesis)